VTHDRHLIDRVATRVVEIHDGELLNHLSSGRYWEARNARLLGDADEVAEAGGGAAAAKTRQTRETAEEARRRRARLRGVEAAVLRAEKRLGEIDAELAEPQTYADRNVLNRLLDERGIVERQLQREYKAWEKLVDEAG